MVVWQSRFVNRLLLYVRVGRLYVFSYMCMCEGQTNRETERGWQCGLLPSLIVFI